ncbi:uncharacterized protein SCDLUD_000167 [Saccharomycodes ludwigii]|uniref:uncharacterized protein n=1 Tax=Saccharomycodes ludwigii TaxID=36035 RepID=UPI001E8C2299|nr:hypothetical protein SCDLUD_000167 [Saccharomycodes ludwigii]KAH3902587.1 hypothetical protein SCDLUD_000167 [Saccharomycodes ludwigii]
MLYYNLSPSSSSIKNPTMLPPNINSDSTLNKQASVNFSNSYITEPSMAEVNTELYDKIILERKNKSNTLLNINKTHFNNNNKLIAQERRRDLKEQKMITKRGGIDNMGRFIAENERERELKALNKIGREYEVVLEDDYGSKANAITTNLPGMDDEADNDSDIMEYVAEQDKLEDMLRKEQEEIEYLLENFNI